MLYRSSYHTTPTMAREFAQDFPGLFRYRISKSFPLACDFRTHGRALRFFLTSSISAGAARRPSCPLQRLRRARSPLHSAPSSYRTGSRTPRSRPALPGPAGLVAYARFIYFTWQFAGWTCRGTVQKRRFPMLGPRYGRVGRPVGRRLALCAARNGQGLSQSARRVSR
jgi:hypothetical protein